MKKILVSLFMVLSLQAQEISIQQCVVDCKECVISGDSNTQMELAKSQNEKAFYDMADHEMWAFSQMSDYLKLNKIPIKYIELDKCPNLIFQNHKINTIPKNNGVFNYIFSSKENRHTFSKILQCQRMKSINTLS